MIPVEFFLLHLCCFRRFVFVRIATHNFRFRVVVILISKIVYLLFRLKVSVAQTTLTFLKIVLVRVLISLVHPPGNLANLLVSFVGSVLILIFIVQIVITSWLLRNVLIDVVVIINVVHLNASTLQAPNIILIHRPTTFYHLAVDLDVVSGNVFHRPLSLGSLLVEYRVRRLYHYLRAVR